jgi:hypothetical protein
MPSRNIVRGATIQGYANARNAPVYVDADDNKLKMIPAGSGTTEVDIVDVSSTQTLTNKTLTSPVLTTPGVAVVNDTAGVNRIIPNATAKTIVDGSATSLFEVACAAGAVVGGLIVFMVKASDATDHQVIAGIATYSAENKAGTIVGVITYDTANEAKSVSAGTLTLAFTDTDDTNKATFKVQPTGSLTETIYQITYTVFPLAGTVTIL